MKQMIDNTKPVKIIIEPHADDCMLSLGQHLEDWIKEGYRCIIVTVFSGTRKRAVDAQKYAEAVGAEWIGWEYVEGQEIPWGHLRTKLQQLDEHLQSFGFNSINVYVPLSITHPEHKRVRDELELFSTGLYVDQPYAIIQKNSTVVTDLLRGTTVISYCHPGKRKYRHIPLFKDQSKFFYFNNEEKLLQTFEMIVR